MARVVAVAEFERNVADQVEYLDAVGRTEWVTLLERELSVLKNLLAQYPESGRELRRRGTLTLRKFRLRQLPFYIWYDYDSEADLLRFLQLLHVRQRSSKPRLPRF